MKMRAAEYIWETVHVKQLQEDFPSIETIIREDGEVTVITEAGFAFKMSVMNYNDLIRTDEQKKKRWLY